MLKKYGVNSTRMEKKVAGADSKVSTIVTCSKCGRKYEKRCPSAALCNIANTKCPHCGGKLEA